MESNPEDREERTAASSEDPTSEEAAVFEILLDDDVGNSIEDKFDVLCISGARHMGIDLLYVSSHVELQELHLDVVAGILVRVRPCSRGERSPPALALPGGRSVAQIMGMGRRLVAGPGTLTVVVREADV